MSTITKAALLKQSKEKAELEAARREASEYETEDLVNQAQDIVEDIFYALDWTNVEDGIIKSNDPITEWHNRSLDDIENDWKYLSISRAEIQNAAERYLERPWLRSKYIDWLILNVLTYAEYQATFNVVRSKLQPLSLYIAQKSDSKLGLFASIVWRIFVFIFKWLIWLSLFVASFIIAPYGPIAIGGITAWWIWRKISAKRKIEELMASMFSTYSGFATLSQSWTLVWDELIKSRDKGAVWDGVVYRLVEDRKQCNKGQTTF